MQVPPLQMGFPVSVQSFGHVPQWLLLELRSTQVPPQLVWPLGQHLPDEHDSAALHAFPHMPQLRESVRLLHVPLQSLSPFGQHFGGVTPGVSTSRSHVWPGGHAVAQAPQWLLFAVERSTHVPLQLTSVAPQQMPPS
jgi:hypothetical protein